MSNLRVSKKIENLFIQYIILYQIITSIMNTAINNDNTLFTVGDEVSWMVRKQVCRGTITKVNKTTYKIEGYNSFDIKNTELIKHEKVSLIAPAPVKPAPELKITMEKITWSCADCGTEHDTKPNFCGNCRHQGFRSITRNYLTIV